MRIRQRLAVLAGVHHGGDEIGRRLPLALLDLDGEILHHLLKGLHERGVVGGAELQDLVDPLDEQIAVVLGHAQHVSDHAYRDVARVLLRGVA